MITSKNVLRHELIGLKIEISKSKNKHLVGLIGKVVDETRNMLIIKTKNGEIKVTKEESTFVFYLPSNKTEVKGSLLIGRPEKRMKKTLPKKRV